MRMDYDSNARPTPVSPHSFHIPVMGTGFSIDTPLRVAKYGISSAISLVDDILIEQMRSFHCRRLGLPYQEIPHSDEDARANRITAYLNLLDDVVRDQVGALRSLPFEPGSDITRYFELLPNSLLRQAYLDMCAATDSAEKVRRQNDLRRQVVPGSIDVNIMTKVDRDRYRDGIRLPQEFGDAMAALRGYARSSLRSSIIFSAGINRRVFGYLDRFDDFFPDRSGLLRKKIILKVSDFRSAIIQGKYLAKRGLWISEYRIESGLNCGGHAFATDGHLLGPILEEFRRQKTLLVDHLHEVYDGALARMGRPSVPSPQEVRITVQGGIGTAEECQLLVERYGVDGTGWGTPFLLVPEATNVDNAHLEKLAAAGDDDVYLSDRSPLGVPFWSLRTSASEETRRQRISQNRPGSPCPKGYVATNSEFTEVPICPASRNYQRRKLAQLTECNIPAEQLQEKLDKALAKACICHDLAGNVTLKHGLDPEAHPAVCCGPNIVNFSRVASLEEMVGHIYGRLSLLTNPNRPHMFIRELSLYIDYLREELRRGSQELVDQTANHLMEFRENLVSGVEHYRELAEQFSQEQKERFLHDLNVLFEEIEELLPESTMAVSPRFV